YHGRGVSRFDGASWRTFTKADGLIGDEVTAIHVDPTGKVWFGIAHQVSDPNYLILTCSVGDGVVRFDGSTWTRFTTVQGMAKNFVFAIGADADGHTWVAHAGKEIPAVSGPQSGWGLSRF